MALPGQYMFINVVSTILLHILTILFNLLQFFYIQIPIPTNNEKTWDKCNKTVVQNFLKDTERHGKLLGSSKYIEELSL